jgi:hypothetical protein
MKHLIAAGAKTKNFMDEIQRFTRASFRLLILMFTPALVSACFEESSKPDAGTWTLHSGVTVLSDSGCQKTSGNAASINVHKEEQRYVVAIQSYQACQAPLMAPWLTQTRDSKATLVINQTAAANTSTCECSRSLKIAITDRLEKGDTLFVVSESEVLGYVELK